MHKLSLPAAILININIMMGAGIFINTVELGKRAGFLGGFIYLLVGTLMLPLVYSIAKLVNLYPDGGFYTFGKQALNSFVGFISTWSYFTGKLASATLMIHASLLLTQKIIPSLNAIPIIFLDLLILSIFIWLNMLNIKTGSRIQAIFMGLKLIPIFFAIGAGLYFITGATITAADLHWYGIGSALPLVLYASTGFEATCSLSSNIENAQRNGPRAIFISYSIALLLACIYQLLFYTSLGSQLASLSSYLDAFPALNALLFPARQFIAQRLTVIMHLAIASSALGGAYGIIFSNNWNLYTLAQNHHTFKEKLLTVLNKHHIPVACVLVEGFICLIYLMVTGGHAVPLQQVSALGCVIAYTLSVLSLWYVSGRTYINVQRWIPTLGLLNCVILITACIRNFFISGIAPLLTFGTLLIIGIIMFKMQQLSPVKNG